MKKFIDKENVNSMFNAATYKRGNYSLGISAVVIAIAVVLALLIGLLPDSVKQIDLSSSKVYTIGDTTKDFLSELKDNVKLTVVAEATSLDPRIDKLVKQYAEASDKISINYVDPVSNPSGLEAAGGYSNTILVENEATGKSKNVMFEDIVLIDMEAYYSAQQIVETEFDGEGQLTSAINYVTNDSNAKIYLTSGHGESTLGDTVTKRLEQLSIDVGDVNLLLGGAIPADCSMLIILGPTADISETEKAMLSAYMQSGGSIMYLASYEGSVLPNFEAFLAEYGISVVDGYIADLERYYQNSPYYIFPLLKGNEITSTFADDDLVLMIESRGFTLTDPARETITQDTILTTSEHGQAVTETEQLEGQYVLGVTATESLDDKQVKLIAFSSQSLVEESILTSFPSLVNTDLFLNAITSALPEIENISIPTKSLQVTNNAIAGGGIWRALFVIIIPVALLISGFVIWNRRRKA